MYKRQDRDEAPAVALELADGDLQRVAVVVLGGADHHEQLCLLYTSDAADERSSVDLGGRRFIKKKNNMNMFR